MHVVIALGKCTKLNSVCACVGVKYVVLSHPQVNVIKCIHPS